MIIPYYPVLRSAIRRPAARIWSRSASADSPVRVTGGLVPWRVAQYKALVPRPVSQCSLNSSLRSVRAGSAVPAWCRYCRCRSC